MEDASCDKHLLIRAVQVCTSNIARVRPIPLASPVHLALRSIDGQPIWVIQTPEYVFNACSIEVDTGDSSPRHVRPVELVIAQVQGDAARALVLETRPFPWRYTADLAVKPLAELVTRYYIRLEVADQPGVLAGIARAFGDHQVSIATVIQKETDEAAQTAELVIMTHQAQEEAVQATLAQVRELPQVVSVVNFLRVDG